MPKAISGLQLVKILAKAGFKPIRKSGSHIILVKKGPQRIGCVVPDHKELAIGTLLGILKQAQITKKEFGELKKR